MVQVALEGAISRGSASAALAKGDSPQGDLVPWTVATQFQDPTSPVSPARASFALRRTRICPARDTAPAHCSSCTRITRGD